MKSNKIILSIHDDHIEKSKLTKGDQVATTICSQLFSVSYCCQAEDVPEDVE